VICEIEPNVIEAASEWFAKENYGVLTDPRTEIIYDDARHFLRTTKEKFDIITSDPIHPWVRGAASMYTSEYFDICKEHLNPGGVVTQWVPMYETHEPAVQKPGRHFHARIPERHALEQRHRPPGLRPRHVRPGRGNQARLFGPATPHRQQLKLQQSLADVDLGFLVSLLNSYAGQGPDLQPWLAGAPINRDRNLRLQYLAGISLDWQRADRIYNNMARYRKYPENLITAPPDIEAALKRRFEETNESFNTPSN
jgi:spermidine synthase